MRILAILTAGALLCGQVARAQVELVDPDAPRPAPAPVQRQPRVIDQDTEGTGSDVDVDVDEGSDVAVKPVAQPQPRPKPEPVKEKRAEPPPPKSTAAPPITVERVTDADFHAAWEAWLSAANAKDVAAEQQTRQRLVELKERSGAGDLDVYAVGMLRAAFDAQARKDTGAAVEMALGATQLAPGLPAAWVDLGRVYFQSDPSEVGRYLGAWRQAASRTFADARYLRPLAGNAASALLLAFIAAALAVVAVLFLRRARSFFYDFHFFFPRVVARWQTAAFALVLLSAPLVFRLGLAAMLLVLFAASTLYLSTRERVVAVLFIGGLGVVPLLAGAVVARSAFAGTEAEDLYRIERGGPGLSAAVERLEALAREDRVGLVESSVLGRHFLRAGDLDAAARYLRRALALEPEDPAARVNLAVTLFLGGDLENPRAMLEPLRESGDAVALFDLGRFYQRRVVVYGDSAAGEVDRATSALVAARALDPDLPPASSDVPTGPVAANVYLRTKASSQAAVLAFADGAEAGARVRSQLSQLLLGTALEPMASLYPLLAALLLLGLGYLGPTLAVSKVCARCGGPVSRRGDPDLSPGSLLCTGCVNVYVRKSAVAPALKVRKQLEVTRHQQRSERLAWVLGAVWSGMGHVYGGATVRGALYGFFFALLVVAVALRRGLLRAPYEPLPSVVWLVPVGLALALLYLLTLRGLRRREG